MRMLSLAGAFLLAATVGLGAEMTIIWSNFGEGNVPLTQENIAGAMAACPEDGEPQAGHELTPCQEEWWNDGDPLPGGGG